MSSRALRKLQREQEEQKQLANLHEDEGEAEGSEVESSPERPVKQKVNAFDLLEGASAEESEDEDEAVTVEEANTNLIPTQKLDPSLPARASKPKKKKKKGKKKVKDKVKDATSDQKVEDGSTTSGMDEIDRALKELSMKKPEQGQEQDGNPQLATNLLSWTMKTSKLLSVDTKHLNPLTEMKSLFGHVALETPNSDGMRPGQRRGQAEGVDLGTALSGRYSPASRGQDFGTTAGRRNIFMQAKPEWPRAASGGLGMEFQDSEGSGIKLYMIVHNNGYTATQQSFQMAVEMMQPERMIQLLQFNPYHIATLLQVSEIAKHQGDHSVAADLLERALFTFGRSVHSTFSVSLRDGLARLAFDVPENRELWLAIWRYISNLGMRGTWRTAFEWAKVLLSLSPLVDPYAVTLFIDQLALRGRQQEQLIRLCERDAFGETWEHLPNIQISLALAYYRVKDHGKARRQLALAMHKFPYIIARLFQELDLSPIPKAIWGSLPSTDAEKLYTELYVTRAKDIWNTPETTSLLVEVAQTIDSYDVTSAAPPPKLEISLEEARHIILTETPAFIALLPRHFTNMPTSGTDPVPPPTSAGAAGLTARAPNENPMVTPVDAIRTVTNAGAGWFTNLMGWFQGPRQDMGENEVNEVLQEALQAEESEVTRQLVAALENQQAQRHTLQDADEAGDDPIDSADSMPALESVPELESDDEARPRSARAPHAATVEDDFDEAEYLAMIDREAARDVHRPGQAIIEPAEQRDSASTTSTHDPSPTTDELPDPSPKSLTNAILNDPQRIQRWLLSTGLDPLRPLLNAHGANLAKWPTAEYPTEAVDNYYIAFKKLRENQRTWVMSVLEQRDKKSAEMVANLLVKALDGRGA